ncbi:MAG: RNA polymerase sporulation sigma factor SigH [Eubacteriales bacterium]
MSKSILDYEDPNTSLSDDKIVSLAKNGDKEAEEYLIRKYKEFVKNRSHQYYIAGADRDDIIQEGMIGIFKAIRDYEDDKGASFSTFAELCITRQIISAIKQARRLKHGPLNTYISLSKPISDEEPVNNLENTLFSSKDTDPESMLLLKEEINHIETNGSEIFSKLEQKVLSGYINGKNYVEIAALLGKSPKSIDNAIQRIKKKLDKYLRKQ